MPSPRRASAAQPPPPAPSAPCSPKAAPAADTGTRTAPAALTLEVKRESPIQVMTSAPMPEINAMPVRELRRPPCLSRSGRRADLLLALAMSMEAVRLSRGARSRHFG